ncbi:MAG: radical SAM protein [Gemmatimonadetes bacterium]|nr:MAG: radical SAM protein [Gemmatimonadota bacterium]
MKIAFVNIGGSMFTFHNGIAALSAYIKHHSEHEVALIDMIGHPRPLKFQHQVEIIQPDVIAFTAMTIYWPNVRALATRAKQMSSAKTIVGGYHPTFAPEECISHPAMDVICRGEGEEALLAFLNALERGEDYTRIPNLWVKKDGNLYKNDIRPLIANMDELPFWDRDLFNYGSWYDAMPTSLSDLDRPERTVTLAASRGCYYDCTYCSNEPLKAMYGGKTFVRTRSVDHIIKEMKMLKARYNPDLFEFQEELFVAHLDWLEEFADKYKREIGLPFNISYREELARTKNMELLAKAGCNSIAFGVECGSEEYRKKYLTRRMSNRKIEEAFDRTHELGMKALSFNIIGMPFETYDLIQETIQLNRRLQADYLQWFIYQPYPGTILYNICKENDLLLPGYTSSYISLRPGIKLTHITREEFQQCMEDFMALQREQQGYDWLDIAAQSNETLVNVRYATEEERYDIMDLYNQTFQRDHGINRWEWFRRNPEGAEKTPSPSPTGRTSSEPR